MLGTANPKAGRDGDRDRAGDGSLELLPSLQTSQAGLNPGFIPCACCVGALDRATGQLEEAASSLPSHICRFPRAFGTCLYSWETAAGGRGAGRAQAGYSGEAVHCLRAEKGQAG